MNGYLGTILARMRAAIDAIRAAIREAGEHHGPALERRLAELRHDAPATNAPETLTLPCGERVVK